MKEIYTEIEINASAGVVWDIVTDFDNFPRWNPFIREISGMLQKGSMIRVVMKPPNSSAMTFKPAILEYKPEEKLRWLGKLWIPKLFDGEHNFIIKKIDENKVLFIQKENFSGLLVPILSGLLKNTEKGFEMMNRALKEESEKDERE